MATVLKTGCEDMVMKQMITDSKKLIDQRVLVVGKQKMLHLSVRKGKYVVTRVIEEAATGSSDTQTDTYSTSTHPTSTVIMPSSRPNRKATTPKGTTTNPTSKNTFRYISLYITKHS
ncbi:hypothetical protein Hanom_Chr12g01173141 [Helianthus anomalus]